MGRVALVTGGTRGIGEAISVALKAAGKTVVANFAGNEEAAKAFTEKTGIPAYKWDVSDFEACKAGIAKVEAEVGPIEILVNNAGITRDGQFHKMSLEQWNAVINTNLNSAFNMTRNVIEGMRDRKFGRIVCISSINGQKGQFGQTNYSAAKAGEIGFVKALAQETAKLGITVNAIAPGRIDTPMMRGTASTANEAVRLSTPLRRLGQPEEVAATCMFLTSDASAFVTGQVVDVAGGWLMT